MASSSSSSTSPSSSSERVWGTVEDLRPSPAPVRRSLFGPVDHQQLQQDFQTLLTVSAEDAKRRWSYDFLSDCPAAGAAAVEWEELRCQDVPAFYRNCLVKKGGGGGGGGGGRVVGVAERLTEGWSQPESPSSSGSSGEEFLEVTTRGCYRLQRPEKRKVARCRQANITDFFSVKKRKLHHKHHSW